MRKIIRKRYLVPFGVAVTGVALAAFAGSIATSPWSASSGSAGGTLTLAAGSNLNLAITGLTPGDSVGRVAEIDQTGPNVPDVTFYNTPTTSSKLDTNPGGLTITIDKCSSPWNNGASGAPTCSATMTPVKPATPLSTINGAANQLDLGNVLAGQPATYLRVTTTLPATADNTYAGLSSSGTFSFAAH
jgi:hypothetical protein